MNLFLRLCCASAFAALLFSIQPAAAQEFKTTPAKILAESPQRFWARGVVFRDTLTGPVDAKHKIKIGERTAYRFLTQTIGDTYADETILGMVEKLTPGKEYIFTATVNSIQTGFFKKKTHYRVVVNGLAVPAQELGPLAEEVEAALAQKKEQHPLYQQLDLLKELIDRVQVGLTALAATEQTNRASYFDPDSEGFPKLMQTTRRTLNDLGTENKVPDRELFAQILAALVALKEGALTQPEPIAAQPTAEPDPSDLSDPSSLPTVPEVTAEEQPPPPRRHFWQRKQKPEALEETTPASIEEPPAAPETPAEEPKPPSKKRKKKAKKSPALEQEPAPAPAPSDPEPQQESTPSP